jgi:hypothetical protein
MRARRKTDNPVLIADGRTPSEWHAGFKPVTKRMTYDDAYRVTRVEYLNPAGATLTTGTRTSDAWVDPFAAEDQNYSPRSPADPTTTGNPRPMPHAVLPTRVASPSACMRLATSARLVWVPPSTRAASSHEARSMRDSPRGSSWACPIGDASSALNPNGLHVARAVAQFRLETRASTALQYAAKSPRERAFASSGASVVTARVTADSTVFVMRSRSHS